MFSVHPEAILRADVGGDAMKASEKSQLEELESRERELRAQIAAVARRVAALQGLPSDKKRAVPLAERLKVYAERDLPPLSSHAAQQELFVALHEALGMVGSTRTDATSMRWSAMHQNQQAEILEARLESGPQSTSLLLRSSSGQLLRPLRHLLGLSFLLGPALLLGVLFASSHQPWLAFGGSILGMVGGAAAYIAWIRRSTRRALEALADLLGERLVERAALRVRVEAPALESEIDGHEEADVEPHLREHDEDLEGERGVSR